MNRRRTDCGLKEETGGSNGVADGDSQMQTDIQNG